jgi:hypothetical protein
VYKYVVEVKEGALKANEVGVILTTSVELSRGEKRE